MSAGAVLYEPDVPCPAADGTLLATDVYRPADGGRHPAVLQRTPYDKRQYPLTWPLLDPRKLVAAGYVVAIQDVRGRFASGGDFLPYVHEADDGASAVAWLADQPWCDGNVGMYGLSYMGGVQWLAAERRPPALRAIAPATAPFHFHRDHFYRGGALALGLLLTFSLAVIEPGRLLRRGPAAGLLARLADLVDDIDRFDELAAAVPLVPFAPLADRDPELGAWLAGVVEEEVPGSGPGLLGPGPPSERIEVPALQIAGWHDALLQPDLDRFVDLRAHAATDAARHQTRLVVGPWAHGAFLNGVGEVDFGVRASGAALDLRGDLTDLHRRWFDARLRDGERSIDEEPPVRVFVMGLNRWRDLDAWPPTGTEVRRVHLHAGGTLGEHEPRPGEPSAFALDPERPVRTRGGSVILPLGYARGPVEQSLREAHPDVLLFTSEPLERDLLVLGRVELQAWVATTTPDSDLVARLCDVHADGRSFNVVDGILRLRFRESLGAPRPMPAGEPVAVTVDLWSTAHRFAAGHRLRLQVSASDFPRYDRCPGTGESSFSASRILPQRNRLFHAPEHPSALLLEVAEG